MSTLVPGWEDRDEGSCFEAALLGDLDAFAWLLQRYRPRLKAYLDAFICDALRVREGSSDILQEVALQGVRTEASANYLRLLGPYGCLRKLASNQLVERYRHHFHAQMRSPNREQREQEEGSQVFRLAEQLADSGLSPSQELQKSEEKLIIHKALELLAPDDLQLLIWGYVESLSRAVIAERLGISEDAARQRCSRAVKRLAELLKQLNRKAQSDDDNAQADLRPQQ